MKKYKFSEDSIQTSVNNSDADFLFTDTPVPQEIVMQQMLEESWVTD
jgi:hypothetical protein